MLQCLEVKKLTHSVAGSILPMWADDCKLTTVTKAVRRDSGVYDHSTKRASTDFLLSFYR
jgi:hypothetical protein